MELTLDGGEIFRANCGLFGGVTVWRTFRAVFPEDSELTGETAHARYFGDEIAALTATDEWGLPALTPDEARDIAYINVDGRGGDILVTDEVRESRRRPLAGKTLAGGVTYRLHVDDPRLDGLQVVNDIGFVHKAKNISRDDR